MHPPPASEQPDCTDEASYPPLFVLLTGLLLYFLRFGYNYGTSDQDEIIPFLLHRLNPELFTQDWFVLSQMNGFGIRTYFVLMLQGLSWVLPVWLAVAVIYTVAWLLIAGAVYALSQTLTQNRLVSAATVVITLVMTPQWTLGGNELVHTMLVPSMFGWGLGLWGLVFFLRGQTIRAGFMLGLATWMQALVGLQIAGLLGVVLLWRVLQSRTPIRPLFIYTGVFMLTALPALGPLIYQQLGTTPPMHAEGAPSMFYVMAEFRNPHHYLFSSFPSRSLMRFGLLTGLGVISFIFLICKQKMAHRQTLTVLFITIAGFCVFGLVFTEWIPSLFIAQLQLFKMTVLAKMLWVILICGAFICWLPASLTRYLDRLWDYKRGVTGFVLGAGVLVLGSIPLGVDFVRMKVGPIARGNTSMAEVEAWVRTETPRDAVFAVPPSWSGFRSHAQRAIVVNFKAFPYRTTENIMWFDRLTHLAPITLPDRAGPALQDRLDAAFFLQSASTLRRLASQYAFDYVVRTHPFSTTPPDFEAVFTSKAWTVYRINPANRHAE